MCFTIPSFLLQKGCCHRDTMNSPVGFLLTVLPGSGLIYGASTLLLQSGTRHLSPWLKGGLAFTSFILSIAAYIKLRSWAKEAI